MEASRQFIATTIWTGELHNSQADTISKVHWAPQEQDGTEEDAATAEPDNQASVPKLDETRMTVTQSAAELKDMQMALDSLQQGHWLTCTVIDRQMKSLGEVDPKPPTYQHRFSQGSTTWRRRHTQYTRFYTKKMGQRC